MFARVRRLLAEMPLNFICMMPFRCVLVSCDLLIQAKIAKTVTVTVNVSYQTVILSKIVYHNLATSEISENRK